jgi:hypothetical protein
VTSLLTIVPTRGRPGNAVELYRSWEATVGLPESHLLFVVDDDDPQRDGYRNRAAHMPKAKIIEVPPQRMVGALNVAAVRFASEYDALCFMGDDHRPRTYGWDFRLCAALQRPMGIAYGNDLLQGEKMATAVVMTSNIVQKLGYMAPPAMEHLCVDLCWNLWGERLGVLRYLDDVVIEHMHPANGKAFSDAGYEKANSSEQVRRDNDAFYTYRDGGQLAADIEKLKKPAEAGSSVIRHK